MYLREFIKTNMVVPIINILKNVTYKSTAKNGFIMQVVSIQICHTYKTNTSTSISMLNCKSRREKNLYFSGHMLLDLKYDIEITIKLIKQISAKKISGIFVTAYSVY
jgi:hypothetical protein